MSFLITHQLTLILACLVAGSISAILLFRRHPSARAWRIADLLWIGLGGLGALTAVLAGVYKADTGRLERQIDVAYATTQGFDRDAARFRLLYCETDRQGPTLRPHVVTLCDKVEFLSASTARNARLPLFFDVTRTTTPLQSLRLLLRSPASGEDPMDQDTMMKEMQVFETTEFLEFEAEDDATMAAQAALSGSAQNAVAVEFLVIARTYADLIGQTRRLIEEWEYLQVNTQFLAAQIIALCMVAFAAPFRLGKSVNELA